jgi:hypothetical protein
MIENMADRCARASLPVTRAVTVSDPTNDPTAGPGGRSAPGFEAVLNGMITT